MKKQNFWGKIKNAFDSKEVIQKPINQLMLEEIIFIRKRLGWTIFWLFMIALAVGVFSY